DLENYRFPTLDLLKFYDNKDLTINMEEQKANKDKIIDTLRSFSIEISTIKATVGPTVTLYEITPAQGVRISKIRGLEDDIALSLAALGIRIIAPIPGKGTIGIEVPNSNPRIVSMQSIIGSKRFQESNFDLPIALGKTITNEVFMVDLCKMPHLLVAGATGQGKSVGLNAIITSLLYKKHPAELKFVLVDPKKVEFSIYSVIEHQFLAKLPDGEEAIITDVTKVVQTLNSICIEMDSRYDLLKKAHVRNLKEYNEKFINRRLNPEKGHRFMPYIVVIIDEFGDLIMTAGKEIELPIARIAQLARAVGIHMVIATQRPTTNIITGTIKANFPARVAFRVSAMMDSRTILDRPGANQLIGRGDMLFLQGADPVRVQCAFVDTPEVEEVTKFIAKQQSYPTAFYLPEYVGEGGTNDTNDVDMGRLDPLFEEAARLIIVHQQGSTSLIQRKFSIGYNRAGRIMDQLEKAGIVGPTEGSKPRQVMCMDENDLQMKMRNLQ
ncbi:DNA translocase SpoIIIE, partial [termite gut metagenome]